MNKVLLASDVNKVQAILQPVKEAAEAKETLAPGVLNAIVTQLEDVVLKEQGGSPEIYKPVIQAARAFHERKEKECQGYLTGLMTQVSLMGAAGGAVGQTPNILELINVQVENWDIPVRKVTYTRPPRELEACFKNINNDPNRRQYGVWPGSGLMYGLKGDVVPAEAVEKTVFIHFDLGNKTRNTQKSELEKRGQSFVQPGDLALPVAVQLAKYGFDHEKGNLLRYEGVSYVARTEKAKTKNDWPVWDLDSYYYGSPGSGFNDDSRVDRVVAAGSPNPKFDQ